MPRCTKKQRRHRTVCTAALNRRIELKSRNLKATSFGTKKFSEEFKEQDMVWAMIETSRGTQLFDGTNLDNGITHFFYIRYRTDVAEEGQQFWIEFEDRLFDILDVEDLDENHDFLKLSCNERGKETVKVNEG